MSLRDEFDPGKPPPRGLDIPSQPKRRLALVSGRMNDPDALDEAYSRALPDPPEPEAA